MRRTLRLSLLLGSVVSAPVLQLHAQPVQPAGPPASHPSAEESDEEVVVQGKAPRGSAIGDIPPVNVLHSRDVKATGATSFDELLEAIAPQIGAARQSGAARPLVLLNGRRVSSYRELRDIPIEAVTRVDILPEEVALKYGYPPDQKVLNVVLQNHFAETVAQVAVNTASQEGFSGGSGDLTKILLSPQQRTTLNLHAGSDDILRGSQRSLVQQQYESDGSGATGLLIPPEVGIHGTATISRALADGIDATANVEAQHRNGHLLSGLSEQLPSELHRSSTDDSLHIGGTLSGDASDWHWNVASNADLDRNHTTTSNQGSLFAPGSAKSTRLFADLDGTLNGSLFTVPAGKSDVTIRVSGSTEHLDIEQRDVPTPPHGSTDRTTGTAGISVDIPISRRRKALGAIGNLTVNGNAQVQEVTDFGTLTRLGAGANWSPIARLNLLAGWDREENAPSVRQLGDPFLQTPGTRIFDFTNGIVRRVAVVTGGNPDLRTDATRTFKLGANWQPLDAVNFRLRADYARVTVQHPLSDITVSPELEAAFPERFVRDGSGALLSVDLRPVNFDHARRDTLQFGFDFTKPLQSKKASDADIQKLLQSAQRAGIAVPQSSAPSGPPGTIGGAANGRLTFSLTDTIMLVDRATIRRDLPELDYLHGAAIGETGGQPRHQVQAQAGWANNGFGARAGVTWRSATDVDTLAGDRLHFSPFATFDLRLFANVGQYLPIVSRHPWLRGASFRFEVGNLFDARPDVRSGGGGVPLGYEPSMLDPLGRTIMISFRKQFLPKSYYEQQLQNFEKRQNQPQ
jgi:iron complex outermembrane recepter protein